MLITNRGLTQKEKGRECWAISRERLASAAVSRRANLGSYVFLGDSLFRGDPADVTQGRIHVLFRQGSPREPELEQARVGKKSALLFLGQILDGTEQGFSGRPGLVTSGQLYQDSITTKLRRNSGTGTAAMSRSHTAGRTSEIIASSPCLLVRLDCTRTAVDQPRIEHVR